GAARNWEMPNVVAKEAEAIPLAQGNSTFEGINDDLPF
ncbi:MAG: single-stranded DNA-binding protein, partial [Pedobacter sp.]